MSVGRAGEQWKVQDFAQFVVPQTQNATYTEMINAKVASWMYYFTSFGEWVSNAEIRAKLSATVSSLKQDLQQEIDAEGFTANTIGILEDIRTIMTLQHVEEKAFAALKNGGVIEEKQLTELQSYFHQVQESVKKKLESEFVRLKKELNNLDLTAITDDTVRVLVDLEKVHSIYEAYSNSKCEVFICLTEELADIEGAIESKEIVEDQTFDQKYLELDKIVRTKLGDQQIIAGMENNALKLNDKLKSTDYAALNNWTFRRLAANVLDNTERSIVFARALKNAGVDSRKLETLEAASYLPLERLAWQTLSYIPIDTNINEGISLIIRGYLEPQHDVFEKLDTALRLLRREAISKWDFNQLDPRFLADLQNVLDTGESYKDILHTHGVTAKAYLQYSTALRIMEDSLVKSGHAVELPVKRLPDVEEPTAVFNQSGEMIPVAIQITGPDCEELQEAYHRAHIALERASIQRSLRFIKSQEVIDLQVPDRRRFRDQYGNE